MEVYRPREVSHLFSREISRRMPSESCLGIPWGRNGEDGGDGENAGDEEGEGSHIYPKWSHL